MRVSQGGRGQPPHPTSMRSATFSHKGPVAQFWISGWRGLMEGFQSAFLASNSLFWSVDCGFALFLDAAMA